MREIVDKHFADNWVIAFYLGYTVDLSLEWGPQYPAAKTALDNTTALLNVKNLVKRHLDNMPKVLKEVEGYLVEVSISILTHLHLTSASREN